MSNFIIKEVAELPPKRKSSAETKYKEIYKKLEDLHHQNWLEITFNTAKEAYNFRVACETNRTKTIRATQRGSKVYIKVEQTK